MMINRSKNRHLCEGAQERRLISGEKATMWFIFLVINPKEAAKKSKIGWVLLVFHHI